MCTASKAILALVGALAVAHATPYTPWLGTNAYGRFLAFPEVQAKLVLFDLSTVDAYREKDAASATLISGLTRQKEALTMEVGNLKRIALERDAIAKASESTSRIITILVGIGSFLVGGILGIVAGIAIK